MLKSTTDRKISAGLAICMLTVALTAINMDLSCLMHPCLSHLRPAVPCSTVGFDGLFFGGVTLFWKTLVVLIIVVPWICLFSFICYFVTNLILPMRASEQDELMGLDVSKHGERATGYDASFISGSIHNPSAHAGTQVILQCSC